MSLRSAWISIPRVIRSGIQNFVRNTWLSLAAILVMVVAITIILTSFVINITTKNIVANLSKNLKISVYLKAETTSEQKDSLSNDLKTVFSVESVKYVSADEAREQFLKSHANDKDIDKLENGLLTTGGKGIIPRLDITLSELSYAGEIKTVAEKEAYKPFVDDVSLGVTNAKKTIDRAVSFKRYINTISIASIIIFSSVSALIIFNTIRMAIFSRSEEIRIMRLIGATPAYIRAPYLIEAGLYGLIAGLVAAGVVYGMIVGFGSKLATQDLFAQTYNYFVSSGVILIVTSVAIGSGLAVGAGSGTFAMSRYLRLKKW